jgi:putative ABC transport system ATP-binding protein
LAQSAALAVRGVSKTYRDKSETLSVLSGVSFELDRGKLFTLCGPSGAGKTTLLNIVSGLDSPDEGEVWLEGKRIDALGELSKARLRSSVIGIAFQNPNLVGHLTALENVMLPAFFSSADGKIDDCKSRALNLLGRLGLGSDKASKVPSKLSEGERRRVSIARALVTKPKVVLADEPTINLDRENASNAMKVLKDYAAGGAGVLISTHDQDVANNSDQVMRISFGKISLS